jgi:uncharacterized repeat protein (TIGR03803 family)
VNSWQLPLRILSLCFLTQQALGGLLFSTLISFNGANGNQPRAELIEASDGRLYGTTFSGGRHRNAIYDGDGTAFRISPNGKFSTFAFLDGFDGAGPTASLVQAADGTFYGTTFAGGAVGYGSIFKTSWSGTITNVYSFFGAVEVDGNLTGNPAAGLLRGVDGNYYGTTQIGGGPYGAGAGTVFRLDTNGLVTPLHSFERSIDGGFPTSQLVQGLDGNLYGTTTIGGAGDGGTIFSLSLGGIFSTLVYFNSSSATGFQPAGRLLQDPQGNFYGTTAYTSNSIQNGWVGSGTVFKFGTNGTLTTLLSFSDHPGEGEKPEAGLIRARNGFLYGTTSNGGYGYGTVFQLGSEGALTTVFKFNGTNGARPLAGLLEAQDGTLYGTTSEGGRFGVGTVFRLKRVRPLVIMGLHHELCWTRTSQFTLHGKTKCPALISGVFYRVNESEWTEAATMDGWTNWTANVVSRRRFNSITAYAVDKTGDTSHTNTLRYFTVESAPR